MKFSFVGASVVLAGGLLATDAVAQQVARDYAAEYREAIGRAKTAAGNVHLVTLSQLCVNPPANGPPSTANNLPGYVSDPSTIPPREAWYADSRQIFDDMYFLGGSVHAGYLLDSGGEGYILIDTEYPYNSGTLVLDGMRRLGLDPADIKYIIISHAHGDHIGGVELVQEASGAPVVLGEGDWNLIETYPNRYATMTPSADPNMRIVVPSGEDMDITLGNKTVHIFSTPGHTPGTLSYTFEVHDFGRPVGVAYSGGTLYGFQTDVPDPGIENLQRYIDSQRKMQDAAAAIGAEVIFSNHVAYDGSLIKARLLSDRGFGPNPYVVGEDLVQRYFEVMIACSEAKIIGLEEMRDKP
jgi:metallo-beta-lactamase class B